MPGRPPGPPEREPRPRDGEIRLLQALSRTAGLGPRPGGVSACPCPPGAWPGWAWGVPFWRSPGGLLGVGPAAKAAKAAGGHPAPCGRRRGPALRVFSSAKCPRQKLRRPWGRGSPALPDPSSTLRILPAAPTSSRRVCPRARPRCGSPRSHRAARAAQPAGSSPDRRSF